jgi:dipeptidyl aminopeptidase/acylaminoacyl peptidase
MTDAADRAWETTVALMAKIGACSSPSFSPDGSRIAFVSDLTGIPQVWTVATEGGWPEQVTALDDQVAGVRWSPDGTWLAFGLAPGGGMNSQIYVVRPDGSGLRRLTAGGQDNNWLGEWTGDGKALAVSSNRDNPDAMDCYLLHVADGTWQRVATNPGVGSITDTNQTHAIVDRMANRGDNNLVLVDLQDGTETLLTPHEGPGTFEEGRFAPDGRTIYLASNAERELLAFGRIRLDDAMQPGPIEILAERTDAELESFELSPDGSSGVLIWNVAGRAELAVYDTVTGTTTPGPQLPAELAFGVTFGQDGTRLAFAATGSAAPLDIWAWERASGRLWQVTRSQHAGVALDTLVRPELVRFRAHDGLELSGWLFRPRGATSAGPVVLSFHGGPEGQERPWFNSTYQALLGQGIAVFAPNVRGSSGFGKTFVNLDNGALRYDAIRDIQACAEYVVASGVGEPGRIGIMGGSYGGYMTMAGLADYPDLFAAGANLFGVVNFETFFEQTEPWMAAISKVEYGDPDTERDLLRDLSPIHKLDRVIAPTLVLHGANDTNVPVVEAEQVVQGLQRRGVPVEYVLFPDEGHGFRKTPNRIRSTTAIVRWFMEHLRG